MKSKCAEAAEWTYSPAEWNQQTVAWKRSKTCINEGDRPGDVPVKHMKMTDVRKQAHAASRLSHIAECQLKDRGKMVIEGKFALVVRKSFSGW